MTRALVLVFATAVLAGLPASGVADSGGARVELGALSSRTPGKWTEVPDPRPPRTGYFLLPRARGDKRDAEVILFHFRGGGGGSADANIERWKSMFEPPKGTSIDDATQVRRLKVAGRKVTYVDIRGTYLYKARPVDPDLRAERRPKHRMISVVFETKKGPYFIRFVGPQKSVAKHKPAFDRWLKAFK